MRCSAVYTALILRPTTDPVLNKLCIYRTEINQVKILKLESRMKPLPLANGHGRYRT
jgi:hypothetical protein